MSLAVTALTFLSVGLLLAMPLGFGLAAVALAGYRVLTLFRWRAPR